MRVRTYAQKGIQVLSRLPNGRRQNLGTDEGLHLWCCHPGRSECLRFLRQKDKCHACKTQNWLETLASQYACEVFFIDIKYSELLIFFFLNVILCSLTYMAVMVKRLSQGFVVPLLRVQFPLTAPQNLQNWRSACASEINVFAVDSLRLKHLFPPARRISSNFGGFVFVLSNSSTRHISNILK